ncbi:uncharacterized protein PAN0_013d4600 [Moesziomyces antarcticus]|uniref:Uncharacterized protein n=2 Tax=Pseudozyma antarctica TaxID=84753 RepID=A0A5C3FSH4_PSEA2|nr:uncharacterized protein PAN0_013d4600 [Moesziomyces antarcticus]GAK66378.1 hypothetical protein PAN0_013d4600 [Moesziomyces antarcticus]SPO47418.1 uncharacterized protein PSANT_05106 [Moesziomyces antarcticus]
MDPHSTSWSSLVAFVTKVLAQLRQAAQDAWRYCFGHGGSGDGGRNGDTTRDQPCGANQDMPMEGSTTDTEPLLGTPRMAPQHPPDLVDNDESDGSTSGPPTPSSSSDPIDYRYDTASSTSVSIRRCNQSLRRAHSSSLKDHRITVTQTDAPASTSAHQVTPRGLADLPFEVIGHIISFIDRRDLAAVSSVRPFRHHPDAWKHVRLQVNLDHIDIPTRAPCTTSSEILELVRAYSDRSRDSRAVDAPARLESVLIEVPLCPCRDHLIPILEELRRSCATLRQISISIADQALCLEELYSHCPRLSAIDLRFLDKLPPFFQRTWNFPSRRFSQRTFALDKFYAPSSLPYCDLSPNTLGLRYLKDGLAPSHDLRGLVDGLHQLSPTLQMWDCSSQSYAIDKLVSSSFLQGPMERITFDQLQVVCRPPLLNWLFYLCPSLKEAYQIDFTAFRIPIAPNYFASGYMLSKWEQLRRLELELPASAQDQEKLLEGITYLRHLKVLYLNVRRPATARVPLRSLYPMLTKSRRRGDSMLVPVPSLETLNISGLVDPHEVLKFVWLRHGTAQGKTWYEICNAYNHRIQQLPDGRPILVRSDPQSMAASLPIPISASIANIQTLRFLQDDQRHAVNEAIQELVPTFSPSEMPRAMSGIGFQS